MGRRDGEELGIAMAMELSYQGRRGALTHSWMTHLTWSLSTVSEAGATPLGRIQPQCTRSRIRWMVRCIKMLRRTVSCSGPGIKQEPQQAIDARRISVPHKKPEMSGKATAAVRRLRAYCNQRSRPEAFTSRPPCRPREPPVVSSSQGGPRET